jgi:FlaG/FlaF family flagellin (archaellin)
MNDRNQHDEAVSSVVGEMIMIALVIILVALFATSAFSLVPGGRETSVDVHMEVVEGNLPGSADTLHLWHKGGDWVEKKDLTVLVIRKDDGSRDEYTDFSLYDHASKTTNAFDLGGCLKVNLDTALKCEDIVRLVTPKNVIYSGEIQEAKQP